MDDQEPQVVKINKNELKTLIIEWLALDEQMKKLRNMIKDLNSEKLQFEEKIMEMMDVLEEEIIITEKGNIKKVKKEVKSGITPALIESTLKEILKSEETAKDYTNTIIDKRSKKSVFNLKHLDFNKKTKSLIK